MSRRAFLARSTAALAGGSVATAVPAGRVRAWPGSGANDRIGIGLIGAGRRAHQMMGEIQRVTRADGAARVVAVSDVWPRKAHDWIKAYRQGVPPDTPDAAVSLDYRALLDRRDVDAVIITTCDHWHALPAIHACQAGKDVYGEKPLSLTVPEGRAMVDAVRRYDRVFQTGSQQRSYLRNRQACELLRNGCLGEIREVICTNYASSRPASAYVLREEAVPAGLDWDRWCGQTALVPFSKNRYLTYEDPGWQWIRAYSGGLLTNWGAHGLDMVQWALGTDDTGPVAVEPHGGRHDSPVTYRYANGIVLKLATDDSVLGGGHFKGSEGELFMTRGKFHTVPIAISRQRPDPNGVRLARSDNHMDNWLHCIRSRARCVADVEIGHRTATICHLGGIARRLGRTLRWDPQRELFPDDDEANGLLGRAQRAPYQLPDAV